MGLSLAGPSGLGLRLRALRWFARGHPVTDASGFPYRPSFNRGLGWCTGAVSCGRRHRPFRVSRATGLCCVFFFAAGVPLSWKNNFSVFEKKNILYATHARRQAVKQLGPHCLTCYPAASPMVVVDGVVFVVVFVIFCLFSIFDLTTVLTCCPLQPKTKIDCFLTMFSNQQ